MAYEIFEQILRKSIRIEPLKEHKFYNKRKWRIDYAWPEQKLAIEVEGGIWINGGHNRGKIYKDNVEKYNELVLHGYDLLRFVPDNLLTYGIDTIIRWFQMHHQELLI